jgi:tRNA threonylcarbamoyladenosine biosynthesis protein TsaB
MNALNLLAIETSSRIGTVALAAGDAVHEREIATPREQTARVIGLIDAVLTAAGLALGDLDALVLGRGPGSFTGLRVAAGVIQGLSLASGTPIVSVSSLAALARQGFTAYPALDQVLCLVDARMGEVYSAGFARNGDRVLPVAAERIGPPAAVEAPDGAWLAIGDALSAHAAALAGVVAGAAARAAEALPRARDLLPLAREEVAAGHLLPLESALPVYLREADAWRRA